jgi:hypothetical protein
MTEPYWVRDPEKGDGRIILASSAVGGRRNLGQSNLTDTRMVPLRFARVQSLEYTEYNSKGNAVSPWD